MFTMVATRAFIEKFYREWKSILNLFYPPAQVLLSARSTTKGRLLPTSQVPPDPSSHAARVML